MALLGRSEECSPRSWARLRLLGAPLFAIMGGAAELAWLTHPNPDQQVLRRLASDVFGPYFAGSPIITTIPLFTFVGYVMAESKTPERLVRAATAWLGWMPGGLAIVVSSRARSSRSSPVAAASRSSPVGGLLLPALPQERLLGEVLARPRDDRRLARAPAPWALPLLVYAMITGLDFQLVNKAVLLPDGFVLALLAVYCVYIGVKEKIPRQTFDLEEALAATWAFKWEMGVFVLLILSIKTQLAGIDEAAGLIAAYTLGIEVWVYKDLTFKKDLVRIARGSMALAGAVILILAMANALVSYVGDEHLPNKVLDAMLTARLRQDVAVPDRDERLPARPRDDHGRLQRDPRCRSARPPVRGVLRPRAVPRRDHVRAEPRARVLVPAAGPEPVHLELPLQSARHQPLSVAMPFVGLLALALLVITYVPRISNQLVLRRHRQVASASGEGESRPERGLVPRVRAARSQQPEALQRRGQEEVPERPDAGGDGVTRHGGRCRRSFDASFGDRRGRSRRAHQGTGAPEAGAKPGRLRVEDDILNAIKGTGETERRRRRGKACPEDRSGVEDDLMIHDRGQ